MKKAALTHPKMLSLATILGTNRRDAIGIITLLLDFTATYAPAGDIGKWPDSSIAGACEWREDTDILLEALITSGWLDRDPTHRLLVHDWQDHCESWVKAKMSKEQIAFAVATTEASPVASPVRTAVATTEASLSETEKPLNPTSEATSFLSLPSLTLPSHTKPSKRRFTPPSVSDVATHCKEKDYRFDPEQFVAHYEARGWKLGRGQTMKSWKAACVTWHKNSGKFSETHSNGQTERPEPRLVFGNEGLTPEQILEKRRKSAEAHRKKYPGGV